MAEHVDQPVDVQSPHLSVGTGAHYAGISDSSIGNVNSLAHIVNPAQNPDRLGPPPHVPIPRGQPHRQADRDWRYARVCLYIRLSTANRILAMFGVERRYHDMFVHVFLC
jgi:hypothetical protein